MKDFLLKNKFPVAIIALATLAVFVSCFYIGYSSQLGSDATEFYEAASYLSKGGEISRDALINRVITSPLFLYFSIAVNYLFHDFKISFSVINIIFYFLTILSFYFLAVEIYKEKKTAFLSSVLVLFNFYIIDPGNAYLADMGGWLFYMLATWFALKYANTGSKRFYYLSAIIATIGTFFKEYGGLALVNLAIFILLSDKSWKQKIKDIIPALVIFLIPLVSFYILIFVKYHVSYLDKFMLVGEIAKQQVPKNLTLLIKILGWLFSFGWLAFIWGIWHEYKTKDWQRIKVLLIILPVTLTFYIWPAITQRLAVMLMMWLALVAGFGLSKVKWYILYPFLVLYIGFNVNIKILIDKINLPF